jgi:ubiquinone/menaquinone biosynthesis C-methylase UbiE
MPPLPYFDRILDALHAGDAEVTRAFGAHIHWGFWDDVRRADGSVDDFALAEARLARQVIHAGGVRDGTTVLDVGCGFGGTLAEIDAHCDGMNLVGLNIDARQLDRARSQVVARPGNRVEFVTGDAGALPFADASFDVVLCVEAIFHFPSRQRFFAEARRVLRPGGRLALCDFVPRRIVPWLWDRFDRRFKPIVTRMYGPSDMRCTPADYRRLARGAGLRLVVQRDITAGTWPTYEVLRPLVRKIAPHPDEAEDVIRRVQFTTRIGLLRYLVLAFTPS